MPLIQRENKKVKRIAAVIAILINAILFYIAWITGAIPPEIKQFITTGKVGEATKPPPPPPPPPKTVDVKKPPSVKPVFDPGKMNVKPDIKVEMDDNLFQLKDFDMGEVDFSGMAEDFESFDMGTDEQKQASFEVQGLMTDLIGDIAAPEDRTTKFSISGEGKRTRGRFSWTNAKFPSNYWADFVSKGGLTTFLNFVNTSLSIKIDANAKTIDFEQNFDNWLKQARETIVTQKKGEMFPEDALLEELRRAVYELTKPDINAFSNYLQVLWSAFDTYLMDKYKIAFKDRPVSEILKDFEKEGKAKWFIDGLTETHAIISKIEKLGEKKFVDGSELRPVWMFAKRCEVMESPLLYFYGAPGINSINDDMIAVLRTYINNGGFIWLDDHSADGANEETRAFIQRITGRNEMDEVARKIFSQLSMNDRAVSGFELLGNTPEPFHPYTYIQFILPEKAPVSIRIYNKVGYLVREYDLGELPAGAYADRNTAPKWDCKDQKGNDVASGTYFVQMESGIFIKTIQVTVSYLRMLDANHPLYSEVYSFDNVPIGYLPLKRRPYGNATFGYSIGEHLAIVYNEGNAVTAGCDRSKNPAMQEAASKWIANIVVHALTQPTGIVARR